MKIGRFIDGAIAGDGGTIACRVALGDGTVLWLGLDGRMPKTKAQRLIFIGASYPTLRGARILERGSREEEEVIAAIQDCLGRTDAIRSSESLMEASPRAHYDRDPGYSIAVTLMNAISER